MRQRFLICIAVIAAVGSGGSAAACRFWGLVGDGYTEGLIADHLRDGTPANLRILGTANPDGWGIAFIHPDTEPNPLGGPVIRRRGSPSDHPGMQDFDRTTDEVQLLRPRIAIAHVRRCTVSHCTVPDPHPFLREGILFAHNGRMRDSLMAALLTADDPDYLLDNPPDYDSPYIDSELYFLYLLKYGHDHPEQTRAETLCHAVYELSTMTLTRLNFVMAAGDTLFVLRHAPTDDADPVRYYPAGLAASPYWVAASEPLGSEPDGWGTVPSRTLVVLVPGQPPTFMAVTADPASGVGEPVARPSIGRMVPNPTRGRIAIPLLVPEGGAWAALDVLDVRGRLVWRDGPRALGPGMRRVTWDARSLGGEEVPSGSYWCRIRMGDQVDEQRLVIVR